MGLFGRGGFKELGKTMVNGLTTPIEGVLGQNFYDPELEGKGAKKIVQTQDTIGKGISAVAPIAATAVGGPMAGLALQGARMGLGAANSGAEQWADNGMGGIASSLAGLGLSAVTGGLGQAATGALGSSVAEGGLNAGIEGSMQTTFQQGLSGTTGVSGFGSKLSDMNQFGMSMMKYGGQLFPYGGPMFTGGNLASFNGPSHEDGGINYQNKAEIELQETVDMGSNFVYSDKLKRPGTKHTFAKISEKYKDKEADDDITLRTNKMMREKLAKEQEDLKSKNMLKDINSFMKKYGGKILQYPNGGPLPGNGNGDGNGDTLDLYPASMFENVTTPEQAIALWKGQRNASGKDLNVGDPNAVKLLQAQEDAESKMFFEALKNHTGMAFNQSVNNGITTWSPVQQAQAQAAAAKIKQESNPGLRIVDGQLQQLRTGPNSGEHWQAANPNMAAMYIKNQGLAGDLSRKDILNSLNENPEEYLNSLGFNSNPEVMAPTFRKGGPIPNRVFGGDGYNDTPIVYGGAPIYSNGGGIEDEFQRQVTADFNPGGIFNPTYPDFSNYTNAPMDRSVPNENQYTTGLNPVTNSSMEGNYTNGPIQNNPGSGFNFNKLGMALPAVWSGMQAMQGAHNTNPFYNPQYNEAINLMSNRRYNIDPELQQIAAMRRNAGKAAVEASGGSGSTALANIGAAQQRANNAIRQTYATKQNMDNQYAAQEAEMRGRLGSERAGQTRDADIMNQRARANQDAYLQQMMNQVGHMSNVGQTNSIYKQLIDAGYGDLLGGRLSRIANS